MMTKRSRYIVLSVASAISLLASTQAYASQEIILKWSSFSIESEGVAGSGPVVVAGKQDATGITAMTVKAFGHVYALGKEHLAMLRPLRPNGMQLSWEGGYKDLGGRTLYIQLSTGFFVSGIKARKFVVINERGDILIQEPRSP
jgi:hypothetical protein